jgi:glycosyltransferase involved in cell wall biosynthesis
MTDRGRGAELVFVARRPPFPLTNGARIRSHRLLTGLAKAFETTFVTFEHGVRSGEGSLSPSELQSLLPGIRIVTFPGRRRPKRVGQLRSLASARSWEFGRYASRSVTNTLATRERRPRVVHFDDLGVALMGPAAGVLNVYSSHNIEQRIVELTADRSRGLRRRFAQAELWKVRREEQRAWRTMDLSLAVSDLDAAAMRAGGARVQMCPNGTDPVERLPFPSRSKEDPLGLLFVGSVDYQPNYAGLRWFIEHVLWRLQHTVPTVLDVVGSKRRELPHVAGVSYHGQVRSVLPFYERAHVAIVPVLFGSGTRLKVVEAMALGRPVVATPIGAEGLPIDAGVHYLAADQPTPFADALARLARESAENPQALERMLRRARSVAERLFWPDIVARLSDSYRAEFEHRADAH